MAKNKMKKKIDNGVDITGMPDSIITDSILIVGLWNIVYDQEIIFNYDTSLYEVHFKNDYAKEKALIVLNNMLKMSEYEEKRLICLLENSEEIDEDGYVTFPTEEDR